jgi:PAS domain S-box-containing protein
LSLGKLRALLAGEARSLQFEKRYLHKQGRVIWGQLSVSLVRDCEGRPLYIVAQIEDVTWRRWAEDELRRRERLYRTLVHNLPGGAAFLFDRDLRYLVADGQGLSDVGLGPERLEGRTIHEAIDPETCRVIEPMYRSALAGSEAAAEVAYQGRIHAVEVVPVRDDRDAVYAGLALTRDVTERRRAEEALMQSERRFRRVLESSRDVIYQLNLSTLTYDYASPSVRDVLGYTLEEFDAGGLPMVVSLTHPEDLERIEGHVARLMANQLEDEIDPVIEYRMRVPGKGWRWMSDSRTVVRAEGGSPIAIVGSVRDVTDKRVAEERLRDLPRRLIRAQEEERRHIAGELHDEIGQVLSAVGVNLQAVKWACDADARPRLEESIAIVDRAIQQVRNLSLDLRPSMLDDLGLVSTLRWYADRQSQLAGFALHFAAKSSGARLPAVVVTACYRVVQEAVTNVIRHAHARHVWLEYQEHEEEVRLVIRDDGVGFDPADVRRRAARGASFGVLGMQERVELLGGRIDVESRPGQGTSIRIRIPVVSPPSPGNRGVGARDDEADPGLAGG